MNTTYSWTNSNSSIGLAASGTSTGIINSFTAINTTTNPITSTITVTPKLNGCNGLSKSFTITVNPTPKLTSTLTPSAICSGTTFNYTATSATTNVKFAWTRNSIAGIIPTSSASTDSTGVISEILTNNTTSPIIVTYKIFLYANGCSNLDSIKFTINPTPIITNNKNFTVCSGSAFNHTITTDPTNTTVSWTRALVNNITPATSNGTTKTINETLTNLSTDPITVKYSITLTANGCSNNDSIKLLVNPIPSLNSSTTTSPICSGTNFSYTATSTTPNTKFAWTRSAIAGITQATSNSSDSTGVINETLTNSTASPINVIYNFILNYKGCTRTQNVSVVVNPTPKLSSSLTPPAICSGSSFNYTSTSATANVKYTWIRNTVAGITPSSSSSSDSTGIISEALTNSTASPIIVTYKIFLYANGCNNVDSIKFTINPTPVISNITFINPSQCSSSTGSISFNVSTSGTHIVTYTKNGTAQTPINLAPVSGVITIPTLGAGVYDNIIVTLSSCPSNKLGPITLVDPNPPATPVISAVDSICSGKTLSLTASTTTSGTATYSWTGPNGFISSSPTPSISNITLAGTGDYKVTVTINSCVSSQGIKNIRVDATPVTPVIIANTPICSDSTLRLSSSTATAGVMSYAWTGPNSFTSIVQNPTITNVIVAATGTYNVVYTSQVGGCISAAGTKAVVVNQTPVISFLDSLNPTNCASATGYIRLSGLLNNTSYTVHYLKGATPVSGSVTSNGSGQLTIGSLTAGTYSNIYVVTLAGCPSNTKGPYTLVDPNPPATPVISAVDSICSGKTLSLTTSTTIRHSHL